MQPDDDDLVYNINLGRCLWYPKKANRGQQQFARHYRETGGHSWTWRYSRLHVSAPSGICAKPHKLVLLPRNHGKSLPARIWDWHYFFCSFYRPGHAFFVLGNVSISQNKLDNAFSLHSKALDNWKSTLQEQHHKTADAMHKYGWHLARVGKHHEAM